MLKQRIATAIVLVSAFLVITFLLPTPLFALALALVVLMAAVEWSTLAELHDRMRRSAWLAVISASVLLVWWFPESLIPAVIVLGALWWFTSLFILLSPNKLQPLILRMVIGVMILLPAWAALVFLHQVNVSLLLALIAIVWLADIGAYIVGRQWGKHKLAPVISPGKTVEGVAGGIVVVMLFALLFAMWNGYDVLCSSLWLGVCVITSIFSVIGDLWESKMKRNINVKDSGSLLPGHGGVLDRIDSVTAAAPIFVGLTYALSQRVGLCAKFNYY